MRNATELCQPLTDPYHPMRSIRGNYSIEVLLHAVQCRNDNLVRKSSEVNQVLSTVGASIHDLLGSLNPDMAYPASILIRTAHYHYVTVFCERADRVWLLDPLKKCPQQFLASELLIFLKEMYRSPYFAIFLLQKNSGSIGKTESNVNTQLNQSSNHHDPTVDQDRDDDRTSTSASLNPASDNIPPCTTPRGMYVQYANACFHQLEV